MTTTATGDQDTVHKCHILNFQLYFIISFLFFIIYLLNNYSQLYRSIVVQTGSLLFQL